MMPRKIFKKYLLMIGTLLPLTLTGCAQTAPMMGGTETGVEPLFSFPVTGNRTPYSSCLDSLAHLKGYDRLPTISVGEVSDKTGTFEKDGLSRELTQGTTEMLISALYKTHKVNLQERWDIRVPLAEMKLASQNMLQGRNYGDYKIKASDFVVVGALTELNYNIVSGGIGLNVSGIGANTRAVVINVALDVRVIDPRTLAVPYVTSLQKQIYGVEVDANVFRFFGTELVEFEAGNVKNEPLQLGVRSVVEMAAYQIMTEFLKLPQVPECHLKEENFNKNLVTPKGDIK
jgi:curli production assembly/transport component CsgG/holdfast attachment protein HfaB